MKLQVFLFSISLFCLAQSEPTAESVLIGIGCLASVFLIEYRKFKSQKEKEL